MTTALFHVMSAQDDALEQAQAMNSPDHTHILS